MTRETLNSGDGNAILLSFQDLAVDLDADPLLAELEEYGYDHANQQAQELTPAPGAWVHRGVELLNLESGARVNLAFNTISGRYGVAYSHGEHTFLINRWENPREAVHHLAFLAFLLGVSLAVSEHEPETLPFQVGKADA